MADNDKGQALDWDVTEVVDDGGFTLLPAGTYAFEVAKIERERFEGSDKMEACPRAKVTLNVWTSQGWAPVVDRLMLNTKMAWRIARSTRDGVVENRLATSGYSTLVTALMTSISSTAMIIASRRY